MLAGPVEQARHERAHLVADAGAVAIIEPGLWGEVHAVLAKDGHARSVETKTRSRTDALLRGLLFAGPGGCGATARQSRCGDQSGERAAPGDATGMAGAGGSVYGGVISLSSIYPTPWAAGVVGGAGRFPLFKQRQDAVDIFDRQTRFSRNLLLVVALVAQGLNTGQQL